MQRYCNRNNKDKGVVQRCNAALSEDGTNFTTADKKLIRAYVECLPFFCQMYRRRIFLCGSRKAWGSLKV